MMARDITGKFVEWVTGARGLIPWLAVWLIVNAKWEGLGTFICGLWGGVFIFDSCFPLDILIILIGIISLFMFIKFVENRKIILSFEHGMWIVMVLQIWEGADDKGNGEDEINAEERNRQQ